MDDNKTIGGRLLRAFREADGTEDKESIAKILGYESKGAVYKIVSGKMELKYSALINFRNYTNRTIDWLLTGNEIEAKSFKEVLQEWIDSHFDELDREIITGLAERTNHDLSGQIKTLIQDALNSYYMRTGYKVLPNQRARLYPENERKRDLERLDKIFNGIYEHGPGIEATNLLQKIVRREREDALARVELANTKDEQSKQQTLTDNALPLTDYVTTPQFEEDEDKSSYETARRKQN